MGADHSHSVSVLLDARVRALPAFALAVTLCLPLISVPGLESPFSLPKIVLLGAVVLGGGLLVGRQSLAVFEALPRAFQLSLASWLTVLATSAAFGAFVSPAAFVLPVLAVAWFLLLLGVRPGRQSLAKALVFSAGAVAFVAVLQFLGADPYALAGWSPPAGVAARMKVYATLGNPNFVAAFLVGVIPLTFLLAKSPLRWGSLFRLILALEVCAVLATGSRAAILGLAGGVVWLALPPRRARWWRLGALAVAVAGVVLVLAPSRPLGATVEGRWYIWRVVAPHVVEPPAFGWGPGSFAAKYPEWETDFWRSGQGSTADRRFAGFQDHAHNDYLEILVDHGVLGLLAFVGVLVTSLAPARRRMNRGHDELAAGASSGLVALACVALVDFPFMRPTELFVFWTLLAIIFLEAAGESKSFAWLEKEGER